jgi:hypothetical protein
MSEQEEKIERIKSKFVGQTQYLGPNIPHIGLQFGTIFKNGIYPGFAAAIAECPSIGELFVAVGKSAEVQRQLDFDIARNRRGTTGKFNAFYTEIEKWLEKVRPGARESVTVRQLGTRFDRYPVTN